MKKERNLFVWKHPHWTLQLLPLAIETIIFYYCFIDLFPRGTTGVSNISPIEVVIGIVTVILFYYTLIAMAHRLGRVRQSMLHTRYVFNDTVQNTLSAHYTVAKITQRTVSNVRIVRVVQCTGEVWLMKNIILPRYSLRNFVLWLLGDIFINVHDTNFPASRIHIPKELNCVVIGFDVEIAGNKESHEITVTQSGGLPVLVKSETVLQGVRLINLPPNEKIIPSPFFEKRKKGVVV